MDKKDELLARIRQLEAELIEELQKQQESFAYEIRKKKIYFEKFAIEAQKQQLVNLWRYVVDAPLKHLVSVPVIWAILVPTLLFDLVISLFHAICFPLYGIPRVERGKYIIFDRQYLAYLNFFEKLNCAYCSYFNGLIAYVQEIAARTEQYWCPIKHARKIAYLHSHYQNFFDYGDGEKYRSELEAKREDLRKSSTN